MNNSSDLYLSSDSDISSDNESLENEFIGEILNNRYIILKYISKGSFSKIYLVYDIFLNKCFATKMFIKEYYESAQLELLNLKKFNSNYIIKVYDYFSENNKIFIILELLGLSLYDIIYSYNYDLTTSEIFNIFKSISLGVNELHKLKLIHCDLKPENILSNYISSNISNIIDYLDKLDLINVKKEFENMLQKNNVTNDLNKITILSLRDYIIDKLDTYHNEYSELNEANTINFNEIEFKIIDFGNIECESKIENNDVYYKYYRPPEVYLNNNYTTKSDIWVLGCIFYEFITKEMLFNKKESYENQLTLIKNDKNYIKNNLCIFNCNHLFIQLICNMIIYDEKDRLDLSQILTFFFK